MISDTLPYIGCRWYKPSALFRNLCDSCMRVLTLLLLSCVHSLGLGLDLGNSLDRRGENACVLIHESCRYEHVCAHTAHTYIIIIIFIYLPSDVISQEKKKTATSSRSITKASKYAIPLKPTHKLAESMRYLVTW